MLSAFLIGWEFKAFVLALTIPLLTSVWLLFVPGSAARPAIESRRAALAGIGGVAVSSYLMWRMLGAYNERHTPSHPESIAMKPEWEADWLWLGGVSATTAQICAGGLREGTFSLPYWMRERPDPYSQLDVISVFEHHMRAQIQKFGRAGGKLAGDAVGFGGFGNDLGDVQAYGLVEDAGHDVGGR